MSEIIAFIAGAISILSSTPQFIKILKSGNAQAVSYGTYYMLVCAGFLWVLYGMIENVIAILFWNAVGVFLSLSVIFVKYFNDKSINNEKKST